MTDSIMPIDTNKVKGFFTYFDQCEPLDELTNEQAGELFKAMVALFQGKPFEFTDPMVKFAFKFFETTFRREQNRYNERSEKARESANRRWNKDVDDNANNANDANACECMQTHTNACECINGNANDAITRTRTRIKQEDITTPNGVVVGESIPDLPAAPSVPNCPHARIVELYHECLPELPRVKVWEGDRQSHLQTRWRERWKAKKYTTQEEGLEYWRRLFMHVHDNCPWLMGQVSGKDGRPPFRADLAWLVLPRNFAKLIEGRYDRQMQEVA